MKRYLKVFLSILILLGVIVINIVDKSKNNGEAEESKEMEIKAIMVGNMFAAYENVDRELDMDYFYDLSCGTTYSKIEDEIGKPNGGVGSGIVLPYYQVGDQYVVMCFSLNEEGKYDKLSEMSLYTKEKYIDEIPLKQ